ncbi:exodeoxyribonuclease VII large subunit [Periweissella cryptocerci]|uniref:Exodeoxyribonuclease 7 large subunit n=1 Tax=Periweissella cryptocerci TaxID=2506420 RepID=A0A4P6YVD4_9LACO|nr:exodeoxyribonuclease VII large subunit [Periweissella cryptocerci]QBO36752.1 exodeoxyribonuclease VII large subunit [Periweissella cryptocerci]
MVEQQYLTVSALTSYLKRKFDADPYLDRVYLTGEISNWRQRPNHQYFNLKDNDAKISVTMFKGAFQKIKFQPEEGMKVLVTGRVSLYEPQGTYQIIIDSMQPDGVGDLYKAYEQLKNKLSAEGLFDRFKQPLPRFPKRIAVITSPSGAVIRDIITTTQRRYPIAQLVLFPTIVQGDKSAADIVKRLQQVNALDFDTVIIGRGGGSIEDLWPFNEEKVAHAIADMQIPVISSVGHETDTTIADLVADVRAATPTAAAELATPRLDEELLHIQELQNRLRNAMESRVKYATQLVNKQLASYVFTQPNRLYDGYVQRVDRASEQLLHAMQRQFSVKQQAYALLAQRLPLTNYQQKIHQSVEHIQTLEARLQRAYANLLQVKRQQMAKTANALNLVSPLTILGRGYSLVQVDDKVVKTVADLQVADEITIRILDGTVTANVIDIKKE